MKKALLLVLALLILVVLLSGCNATKVSLEEMERYFKGVSASISTYAFDGTPLDRIVAESVKPTRDTKFDVTSGDSTTRGSVVLVSVGNNHISHVGSTMIIEQEGIERLTDPNVKIDIENYDEGTPWVNNLVMRWKEATVGGQAKIILIRSQNSTPLAVFAGDSVEIYSTDIPNSTFIRIDGKYMLVYRCEFTIYDTALIQ